MNIDKQLDHSRPARWDRIIVEPTGRPFLAELEERLMAIEKRQRRRKPEDQARFAATLQAFASDLLVACWDDPSRWLAYGRRTGDYPANTRYRNPSVTYQAVCDVADLLTLTGLAEGEGGFYDRSALSSARPVGRRSRLRATRALVELAEMNGVTAKAIAISPASETIRLRAPKVARGRPGALVEYEDTDETRKLRAALARINALLEATRIDQGGTCPDSTDASSPRDEEDEPPPTDRTTHRLYRVFNDCRFDRGGRFYGWWQVLGKEERQHLLINGDPVIELDFSGMHPRLCYALDSKPLGPEVDPYAVPDLVGEATRDLVKRGFNQLLNGTEDTFRAPAGCAALLPPGVRWKHLLAKIEDHHRPVAQWLRSRRGLDLQAIDAGIAEQVLVFLAHRGVPCLPVHDSFIVARRHEDLLGETMMLAWHGQIRRHGGNPGVPPIKGWSSPELARSVTLRVAA